MLSAAWKSRLVNKMEGPGQPGSRPPPALQTQRVRAETPGVMPECAREAGRLLVLALLLTAGGATSVWAQSDAVRTEARSAAIAGKRGEAARMLTAHLDTFPRDADARLLLGVVLSWDGKYDEAERELRRVLEQSPTYNDARVALANVAWWTGRYDLLQELAATGRVQRPYDVEWIMLDARALDGLGRRREARQAVMSLLARQPGHVQARNLKNRLDTQLRPWTLTMGYGTDRFSDQRTPWNEYTTSLSRQTPVGSVIGRVSHAERFGYSDRLFEVEFYPSFRPGTYGFVSYGRAKDDTLFPNYRVAADLYQSLGRGFEASVGMRRLAFSSNTDIYLGTLTKYVGNWMITGKVFSVPDFEGPEDSLSYHGLVRRYIRGDGESFLSAGYSRGSSREELTDSAELLQLDADTFRAGAELLLGRTMVSVSGSTSRQERVRNGTLWQHSFGASFSVFF